VSGTHNITTIHGFHGAGGEQTHRRAFTVEADHPAVLVGEDHAPTPAEHLLQALGACLMSGLANIAAARGIDLDGVTAYLEGEVDLLGIFGLDDSVRNGFSAITRSVSTWPVAPTPTRLHAWSTKPSRGPRLRRHHQRRPRLGAPTGRPRS
jgi:hypothetical protein